MHADATGLWLCYEYGKNWRGFSTPWPPLRRPRLSTSPTTHFGKAAEDVDGRNNKPGHDDNALINSIRGCATPVGCDGNGCAANGYSRLSRARARLAAALLPHALTQ